ncbi:MAG: 3,4-dihydroxy-2-butanone-4-phosphate synthase, partial [Pseudomonadota bacterium]
MINEIKLDPFEVVLERFKAGQPVLLIDDAERENEGDVCVAAEAVTPDVIAFLMREARGLICVSLSAELASELRLPYQVDTNNSPFQTPFAVSIDATTVAQSGVTASSRAATVRALIAPEAKAEDFVSPGHIFPLIANQAGVLARQGHTEGTFD